MTVQVNIDTIAALSGGSEEVLIYGLKGCCYDKIKRGVDREIEQSGGPLKTVFDWEIGTGGQTLEGRKLAHIHFPSHADPDDRRFIARKCKTGLTNLVLENYKRMKEGKTVIPGFFCLTIDREADPFTPSGMTKKDDYHNNIISHKELRRIYKLCYDPRVDSRIREAAKATFKFVHVTIDRRNEIHGFKPTEAPWEMQEARELDGGFWELWAERMAYSKTKPKSKEEDWREQLNAAALQYDIERLSAELARLPVPEEM